MSENPPKDDNSLNELLDDALKDFEDDDEPAAAPSTVPAEVPTFNAESNNFLKESLEETMKSFLSATTSSEHASELAAGFQEFMLDDSNSDLQTVIQESLKSLSDAKQNLPEGGDMNALLANFGASDNMAGLDEDVLPMLMQFMQPLLSKEVLYPSIKDLCDKYPQWLEEHKPTFGKEEFDKYTKMFECMKEVRDHLESQHDTDDELTKKMKFKELMELLKKMQECGQPPEELLRDLGDGSPMPDSMGQCNLM